ncbi:MAG TPA: tetratricopeptide repeat-containing protein kinase family protein, partial [Kofleriaceae bacterium]|nr:tetratricopeptide repeat-containing protein kinase family protein [Kofleriaceae bacterium]
SGRPQPKIIDFGIAKALARNLADGLHTTETSLLVGTPEYMSPEQADLLTADIDTRSDVYSLGILLYELLVGRLPFASDELRAQGLDELRRTIREVDPATPSAKLATLGATAVAVAENRGTEPATLARSLRGDLDAIVMKALEKERARRYRSPAELADDLGRYLSDEPVLARPPTLAYRLRKYSRRHRAVVLVAGGAATLLLAFTAALAIEIRSVSRERDRANRETEVTARALDFMVDMFKVSDPHESRGATITARAILDRASVQIAAELALDPEVRARLLATMARVYDQLGLEQSALPLAEQAVATLLRVHGPTSRDTLHSQCELAMIERELGRSGDAEKRLREVAATQRRTLGPDDPDTLTSEYQLAVSLDEQGRLAEAEAGFRDVVVARRRVLGDSDPSTLMAMNALAVSLSRQQMHDEAEGLLREVYEIQRRLFGPDHPAALATLHNLGSSLDRSKHFAEAETVNREVVATSRRVYGPENPETFGAMNNLAFSLTGLHRQAEAEQIMLDVLAAQRRTLPPDHPSTALTLYSLACLSALQGRRADALAYLRESLDHGMSGRIAKGIADDPDFARLHGDPAFDALAAEGRARTK